MLNRAGICCGSCGGPVTSPEIMSPEVASPEVTVNDFIGSDVTRSVREIIFRAFFLTGFYPLFFFGSTSGSTRNLLGISLSTFHFSLENIDQWKPWEFDQWNDTIRLSISQLWFSFLTVRWRPFFRPIKFKR